MSRSVMLFGFYNAFWLLCIVITQPNNYHGSYSQVCQASTAAKLRMPGIKWTLECSTWAVPWTALEKQSPCERWYTQVKTVRLRKVDRVMSLKENAHTSGNALIIPGVQKDIRKRCIYVSISMLVCNWRLLAHSPTAQTQIITRKPY